MAHFSDRLVSANKLIIAAAVIYAGCLTFARAADSNLAHTYRDLVEMCDAGSSKACDAQDSLFLVLKKKGLCVSPNDPSIVVRCPR